MKTPEPPRSSKGRDKAEEKDAPKAETPMARFRKLATNALQTPYEKVKKAEAQEKRGRAAKRRLKD